MSPKEFASWGGLVFVGVIGFILGLAPVIADRHIITVEETAWIAFALTLMSLAGFAVISLVARRERLPFVQEVRAD